MNLPKRDAKGRFISNKNKKSVSNDNAKIELIGMANTIKRQNDEINMLNREANFWRITSAIFAVASLISFFAYCRMWF